MGQILETDLPAFKQSLYSSRDAIKNKPVSGAKKISVLFSITPRETTTYEIIAGNPYGTATAGVTVTVLDPPNVSISADPPAILSGGSTTLTWSSTGAGTCTIQPGMGSDLNGSASVTLTQP